MIDETMDLSLYFADMPNRPLRCAPVVLVEADSIVIVGDHGFFTPSRVGSYRIRMVRPLEVIDCDMFRAGHG